MKTRVPVVALVGGGPMALMTALALVRSMPAIESNTPSVQLIIIAKEPEHMFGFGDIINTIHKEVLFNVFAGKMSIDPQNPQEFVEHLQKAELDSELVNSIVQWNTVAQLEQQFVPRILLQPVAQALVKVLKEEALLKNIYYEFIHGEVTGLDDLIADSDRRQQLHSQLRLEIKRLDKNHKGELTHRIAEVAGITFGFNQKSLPGEEVLVDLPEFSFNMHNPKESHILHPSTALNTLPEKYHIGIAGSKLSAVDALLILYQRGYFDNPSHIATVVSPTAAFPYPHASKVIDDAIYKKHSLLSDPCIPERFKQPKTAVELSDAIVVTCLYAAGASFDGNHWTYPPQTHANEKVIQRLINVAEQHVSEWSTEEYEYIRHKCSENRSIYPWQLALDCDFRPHMQSHWKRLNVQQKKYWMSLPACDRLYGDLRHRIPEKVLNLLTLLVERGQITTKPGKISYLTKMHGQCAIFVNENHQQPYIECDQMVKATGWEQRFPIDQILLLRMMRRRGMIHRDNDLDTGVVVSEQNNHNLLIIGQLNKVKYYELSGFQQLREHSIDVAKDLITMLNKQVKRPHDHSYTVSLAVKETGISISM